MSSAPSSVPPRRRALVVNADDLGYTVGVNRAIVRCAREGVLTSATLMAGGAAFDDAVERVRECPGLGVGVHLVLTELPALAGPREVRGLADEEGRLPATMGALLSRVVRGSATAEALRTELGRQVARVVESGIVPTHLDTHKHVHVIPRVLEAVLEVARHHGIRWVRNPFEGRPGFGLASTVAREDRLRALRQEASARAVSIVRRRFFQRLRRFGVEAPTEFVGVTLTGLWTAGAADAVIRRLPAGLTEWMVHPGDCDDELRRRPTRLLAQRQQERDILLLPELRERIESEGIVLTNFREVSP